MLLEVSVFHENLSSLFPPYLPKFVMKFFGGFDASIRHEHITGDSCRFLWGALENFR